MNLNATYQLESFELNIGVLIIFMFLIHYGYRYYNNDTPWTTQTALPQNSNDVVPGEKCRGSIHSPTPTPNALFA